MEKLIVSNTSPLDADISFCFLHDSKADTYMLDPPAMQLKPGQQQVNDTDSDVYCEKLFK